MKETKRLHELFLEIWDEREDEGGFCYCFETGQALPGNTFRGDTRCYDHVLEKNRMAYPQYKFTKKNIVIIHPEVHFLKHQSIDNVPKIKKYKEKLLSLHYENKLEV